MVSVFVCLSVCLCLSDASSMSKELKGSSWFFDMGVSFDLFYTAWWGNSGNSKGTSLWNFVPKLKLFAMWLGLRAVPYDARKVETYNTDSYQCAMKIARSKTLTAEVWISVISDSDTADMVLCSEVDSPPWMPVAEGACCSIIATVNRPAGFSRVAIRSDVYAALTGSLVQCHVINAKTCSYNRSY